MSNIEYICEPCHSLGPAFSGAGSRRLELAEKPLSHLGLSASGAPETRIGKF